MLQRTLYNHQSPGGVLGAREQQLVLNLLRLYRNGSNLLMLEEALRELRAVRKQIHDSEERNHQKRC